MNYLKKINVLYLKVIFFSFGYYKCRYLFSYLFFLNLFIFLCFNYSYLILSIYFICNFGELLIIIFLILILYFIMRRNMLVNNFLIW